MIFVNQPLINAHIIAGHPASIVACLENFAASRSVQASNVADRRNGLVDAFAHITANPVVDEIWNTACPGSNWGNAAGHSLERG